MTSTRIEWSQQKIAKIADCTDLAEIFFPGNRNQQHAFVIVWTTLKWSPHHLVPNLGAVTRGHGVSRRTLERVRAKLRRLGLIDRVSRFNARFDGVEGWILSSRFEHSLRGMADKMGALKDPACGSREKEEMFLEFARGNRHSTRVTQTPRSEIQIGGDDK